MSKYDLKATKEKIHLLLLLLLLLLWLLFGNSSTGEISRHYFCQNGGILFINLYNYTTCFRILSFVF